MNPLAPRDKNSLSVKIGSDFHVFSRFDYKASQLLLRALWVEAGSSRTTTVHGLFPPEIVDQPACGTVYIVKRDDFAIFQEQLRRAS